MTLNELLARLGPRVLLVEDALKAAVLIVRFLEGKGFHVEHVASVTAGLVGDGRTLDPADYDSFLLDHYFPGGIDGTILTGKLRAARPDALIVGISSVSSANRSMILAGADGGLVKRELLYAIEE